MPITPRFSVVIPTRGDAPHLRRALESALAQTPGLEVIVAHAAAVPLPKELFSDPRVVAIGSRSNTPGGRRNDALAAATAPYVAFLDDDDLWLPGHLETAGGVLDADPSLVAVGADAFLFDDDSPGGSGEPPTDLSALPRFLGAGEPLEPTAAELLARNVLLTPAVVARRDALAAASGFDGGLAAMEDWDLWLRLARRGRIRVVREPRVIVRRRPASASRDLKAMATCALTVADRAQAAGVPLSVGEARALSSRLWHELAYACLSGGDAAGARRAARRAIGFAPGRAKNYVYWLASLAPSGLRRRLFAAAPDTKARP